MNYIKQTNKNKTKHTMEKVIILLHKELEIAVKNYESAKINEENASSAGAPKVKSIYSSDHAKKYADEIRLAIKTLQTKQKISN